MTVIDAATLTIIKLTKRFNPECGFTSITVEAPPVGDYSSTARSGDGPYIEKYLLVSQESSNAVGISQLATDMLSAATNGVVEYDLTIQGMEVRLFNLLDIDPVLADINFPLTGLNWRVVDISYEITETGPITNCSLVSVSRPIVGETARRTMGNISMEQAIEKTIDSKIAPKVSATLYGTVSRVDGSVGYADLPDGSSVKGIVTAAFPVAEGDNVLIIPQRGGASQDAIFFL